MIKVLNAFSLSMVQMPAIVQARILEREELKSRLAAGFESFIGHESLCPLLREMFDVSIFVNRQSVRLERGEEAVVFQYTGPRLPEGVTSLPEGSELVPMLITVS